MFKNTIGLLRVATILGGSVLFVDGATLPWIPGQGIPDAQGNLYVAGTVTSDIVPVTAGAFQTKFNAAICGYRSIGNHPPQTIPIPCSHIYVAKLAPDGLRVLWATYIEGSGSDGADIYAVDAYGHVFLAGATDSPDFPVTGTIPGLPSAVPGTNNSILIELSTDGSQLAFSRVFGATSVLGMRLDAQGAMYIAGNADGTSFPTTESAFLHAHYPASIDCFVAKLDIASGSLLYSTLFGGSGEEKCVNFEIDSTGNVYLSGYTLSTDFPVTPDSFQIPGPLVNIFVAKLNAGGSSLAFSSIFAGSRATYVGPMAVDAGGDVYLAGADCCGVLQPSPRAFKTATPGGYAAKFEGTTGARIYLTYLADGNSDPWGRIAPAPDGSAWISLATQGPGTNSPVVMTPDSVHPCFLGGTSPNTYVKHISANGTEQLYGTFLDGLLSLSGDGTARVSDPILGVRTIDLAAA